MASAQDHVHRHPPDLIIIGFDPHEFTADAAVGQIKELSSAPVLVLGCANGVASPSGVGSVVSNPFDIREICAGIAALLNKPLGACSEDR